MKPKLLFALIAVCLSQPVIAECYMQSSVYGKASGTLNEVTDVKTWQVHIGDKQNKCMVTFRAHAKNKWWNGNGEYVYKTSMSEDEACGIALAQGKRALVEQIFNKTVQSEGQMVCSDLPQPEVKKVLKVGDVAQLSEVQLMPGKSPFGYRGAECRWFVETDATSNKDLYTYKGVICNVRRGEWEVLDKF